MVHTGVCVRVYILMCVHETRDRKMGKRVTEKKEKHRERHKMRKMKKEN